MATTNIWQQFKSLIPEGVKTVVMITTHNNNGTRSLSDLADRSEKKTGLRQF
ncbi:hypothetical protein [Endozoicomonas montiporae]|uniref:Uncharacterized protein n=1 Tax=Endozoicomonas montiporae CL-33 TaxID=570277 RepID=A0A142BAQ6_9GAMM|nr:hypothetical protein [Endozoicomonas montiporae]AMO55832.1 hypothetical protein EZMO1_1683 [Endozoicomonas montiporae CL-33]